MELNKGKNHTPFQKIEAFANIKPEKKGTFSIIIPTWNNLEYLKLCIHSLRKNSFYSNQIIVAVNEGNDGSIEWLEKQQDIDYIHFKENAGVCYALNLCRPHVSTDYIVYLNDDMYVYPDWDKELFFEIKNLDTNYFFLSSTLVEPINNNNPNYVAIYKDYGRSIESFDESKLLAEKDSFQMKNWSGSSWPPSVVHKEIWDMVGGYSIEYTPGMYSDPDFSMKLWQAGVRVFMGVGKSKVYHFGEITTKRIKKNKGSATFLQKWGITAKTYYSIYLKMGKEYMGEYPTYVKLGRVISFRNKMKRLYKAIFRS